MFVESAATPEEAAAARARTITPQAQGAALRRSPSSGSLTKDQILERYLNIAYFGAGAYGVEAASLRYFSKHASKLTLVEAATLAGAVQQPVAYDPLRNPNSSQRRRVQVLTAMADLGYITPATAATAAGRSRRKKFLKPSKHAQRLHDVVRAVLLRLRLPLSCATTPRSALRRPTASSCCAIGGLTIRTTLDPAAQQAAQAATDKYIPRKDPSRKVAAITMVAAHHRADRRDGAEPLVGRLGHRRHDVQLQRRDQGRRQPRGAGGLDVQGVHHGGRVLEKGFSPYENIVAPQSATFAGFKNCTTGAPFRTVHRSTTPPGPARSTCSAARRTRSTRTSWRLEQKITQCAAAQRRRRASASPAANGSPLQANPTFTLGTDEVTPLGMASAYADVRQPRRALRAHRDPAGDRPRRQGPAGALRRRATESSTARWPTR